MKPEIINPEELGAAIGYANGVLAPAGSRLLFIAGQIAWNQQHELVGGDDFVLQFEQTLKNVMCVIRTAGGTAESLLELTIFVTDKSLYMARLRDIGAAYRGVFGKHFPAMALVEVKGLLEPGALVEIRGTAAIA